MTDIVTFLKTSPHLISQKQSAQTQLLLSFLQKKEEQLPDNIDSTEIAGKNLLTNTQDHIVSEKVLEIDVIQSSYIPQVEDQQEILLMQQSHQTHSQTHKDRRNLQLVESQKQAILEQLRKIDEEIAIIKGEPTQDVNLRRKEKEIEEEKARKQARQLVKQLQRQKKELQERKRKEHQKQLLVLQQEEEELRRKRREDEQRIKQERKRGIELRMEEEKRKREERKQMDKQSNRLLQQLKKEDQILKMKEAIPVEISEIEQKKKVVEKRQEINFKQIQEHQRKYILMKEQERNNRRDRSDSQSHHHAPKYQKNTWIEKIQEEDFKKKEEEKMKQLERRNQLDKRLKYGQLVKNIFLPKKKQETKSNNEESQKPHTPNAPTLPRIPESEKRVTQSKAMKHFTENNRPFATAHNYKKPLIPKQQEQQKQARQDGEERQQLKQSEAQTQLDLDKQKKKLREQELRKQTKERLRKLQNQSLDLLPQSKPKYENYLGQVKQKRKDDSWKDIIDNGKLSKEEKYSEMLKKANNLQARAKQKQELRKDGDEEAVNLYIGSIQAKLALLEKF